MALSAYFFRPQPRSMIHYRPTPGPKVFYDPLAPWFLGLGVLLLVGALALARPPITQHRPTNAPLSPVVRRWLSVGMLALGVLALGVLAEANGHLIRPDPQLSLSHHLQFALLVGGLLMIALGLGSPRWPTYRITPGAGEIALISALTLLALGLRMWQLGSSVRVLVDEGHFSLGVMHFWYSPAIRLLIPMPTSASFPFLYSYWQAGMVEVFGRGFLGLRATSALLGALTIPALYLLARALYDRTTALIAAAVLTSFPPHLHYSRLALNNIADPLFGTLALALLAWAVRTNRRIAYALGGVMLGLTQYFYEGGRLLFPPLVLAWLGIGWLIWRPRPPLRGLVIAVLACVFVAAPIYYTLTGMDFPLINRLDNTALNDGYWQRGREDNTVHTRLVHFRQAAMTYINSPENTLFYYYLYYGGRHPLILEYIVPAFLLGCVIALWHWRSPGALPALWVLAVTLGNAMLVESAVSARFVLAFPALALLIALGIRHTIRLILPRRPALVSMGILTAIFLVAQAVFYFGPFLRLFNTEVRTHVTYDVEDALLRSVDFPPGTQVHIVGDGLLPEQIARQFIEFLVDNVYVDLVPPEMISEADLRQLRRDIPQAFFVAPTDTNMLIQLRNVFGINTIAYSPYKPPPDKELALYYVPPIATPVGALH